MDDLISRQAAIDECLKGKTEGLPATNVACDCCAERIRALPSAQPKAGKWIKNGNKYTCPFCGTGFTTASEEVRTSHKYCYYCGVKMEGTE